MSNSAIATGLEKLVNNSARQLGTFQVGVNKILWGSGNTQPVQTVSYRPATATTTGSLAYTSSIPNNPQPPSASLINSGLFNALDALNQVDLCNIIAYSADSISFKRTPKAKRANPGNAAQRSLYFLQDQAEVVQSAIDKYTAYPNVFIGSYLGTGPNAVPQNQAVSESNAPSGSGTGVTAYNTYYLMQTIRDAFAVNNESTSSLFTAQDKTLITTVPGLGGNLNVIDDFLGTINKYSDYRQISNADLQALQNKITVVRSVCVTIQNLDFKNSLALAGNFLGTDIRAQLQELSKFVDPTKIIPTLKQINSAVQSVIRIGRQIQGILNLGQFLIKLALLFYKIFKFIIAFFVALPVPSLLTTTGIQLALGSAKQKASDESAGIMRLLKALNALLEVVVVFIRYLLTNVNEIQIRLQILLLNLETCEAIQNSDVLLQLQQTNKDLTNLREQLEAYIIKFDSKIDPNTAMFGDYDIRVVEEELKDPGIVNKRRRGIALNQRGEIVAQSDLTFATNTTVIIAEVRAKLVAEKLVQPNLGSIDAVNISIISDSLNYLDNNDVMQDDLNAPTTLQDSPDNLDENAGLGLNAFVNNLKGGRKLRQRTRAALAASAANVKEQVEREKTAASKSLQGG